MKNLAFVFVFLCVLSCVAKSTDTLYVSAQAQASGDGQSWTTAFATIDEALSSVGDDEEIWVARGTYSAPQDGWSFRNGTRMYGGFNGTEVVREERDWYRKPTILSGKNTSRVMTFSECDSSARFDGFTVQETNGNAVVVTRGCPRIVNCRFRNNTAMSGAAIMSDASTRVRIEYCVFESNTSEQGGAIAIYASSEDPYGFGAFIAQCQFSNNRAINGVGGALMLDGCKTIPQITSCVFDGNTATSGGAIATSKTYAYILNCTFFNNSATGTDPATAYTLSLDGGELLNSIVWNGNLPSSAKHVMDLPPVGPEDTSAITALSNCIEGDFVYGFYQSNPLFEDEAAVAGADGFFGTDDDGLRLSSLSTVRDAGVIDRFVNHRQTDAIGNPRLVGRKIDLGAYESQRNGRLNPKEMMDEMRVNPYSFFYRHSKTDWNSQDPGPAPECFPGRNLIYEGREMMREVGKAQRFLLVPIGPVESSPVCRCWETAELMCGRHEVVGYWGSSGGAGAAASRDSALKSAPVGGNRVITSHDAVANAVFNASGDGTVLTSAELMEGDNLFVKPLGDTFEVVAHFCADTWERYHVRFPEGSTSVNVFDQGTSSVACYPNPASTSLAIETQQSLQVRIVNVIGATLWTGTVNGYATVDVRQWPQGSYYVVSSDSTRLVTVMP